MLMARSSRGWSIINVRFLPLCGQVHEFREGGAEGAFEVQEDGVVCRRARGGRSEVSGAPVRTRAVRASRHGVADGLGRRPRRGGSRCRGECFWSRTKMKMWMCLRGWDWLGELLVGHSSTRKTFIHLSLPCHWRSSPAGSTKCSSDDAGAAIARDGHLDCCLYQV